MSTSTYINYELLRTARNRRFLIFSLLVPLLVFFLIATPNRHATLGGIPFPLYFMTGMAGWGTMVATISSGARISAERQVGWTRQLRITPLRTSTYFSAKIICGYAMALLSMLVIFLAGTSLGVRLSAREWVITIALMLVGLIPFAVLGIVLGHLLVPDSIGPALGGITAFFAVLGGSWGPIASGGALLKIVKCIPSYWLVQAGKSSLGGGGWPPAQSWIVIGAWTLVLSRLALAVYKRDTARL